MFSIAPQDFFSASPFELMRRFTEEMDRVFDSWGLSTRAPWSATETNVWSPAIEVFERDNNLVVRAELPGCNKDDINVELTDDGLVIKGERKREHEEQHEGYYRSERAYGSFYRSIPLPPDVSPEQVSAQFSNGVLEVTAPLPESARRRRKIPIQLATGEQQQAAAGTGKS
jgi:HSP20 family protein